MAFYDLIIVGSGILGTFHAYHAAKAGKRVLLLEKDTYPVGATVRNFGQVVPSGLAGRWFDYGRRSLEIYKDIQREVDITIRPNGSLYVASDEDEWTLLNEHHDYCRGVGYPCELLAKATCLANYPTLRPDYLVGALYFPDEVSVEPDQMIHRLIGYIRNNYNVDYRFGAVVVDCQSNTSGTSVTLASRERFQASRVLICSGHEARLLFGDIMAESGLIVSKLQMMQTKPIAGLSLPGNILTGLTIRRYESFQQCSSFASLPFPDRALELKKWGIHLLFKQALDGSVIIGDSHEYAPITQLEDLGFHTLDHINQLILAEAERIVNFPVNHIQKTWAGFYSQTDREIFEYAVDDNIQIITGIGGKGMTSSAGYSEKNMRSLF